MITADGGGSNGSRLRLWKVALQQLADETGLIIQVCHYPPGTSKWNKIEHRMFCHITQNWRAMPLVSLLVAIELIANTTTKTGLTIRCELDPNTYPKGIKVSDEQMASPQHKAATHSIPNGTTPSHPDGQTWSDNFWASPNYTDLLEDDRFINSLWVSFEFVATAVVVEFLLGFSLAFLFNAKLPGLATLRKDRHPADYGHAAGLRPDLVLHPQREFRRVELVCCRARRARANPLPDKRCPCSPQHRAG